jgi:hypothetical protein
MVSLSGHHLRWTTSPPSSDSHFDLDGQARRFSVTKHYAFQVELDCHGMTPCVADGETVETVISVLGVGKQRAHVHITTEVQALLSCENSRVSVESDPDVVTTGTTLRVQLRAIDMDGMPITSTRAEVSFSFGGVPLPVVWRRGSNDYVADVAAALTETAGVYDLVVSATNAWKASARNKTSTCELLRRTIRAKEGLDTKWVLGGASGAAVVVIGGTVIVVRKRHVYLQAIMVMLFTEARCEMPLLCTSGSVTRALRLLSRSR